MVINRLFINIINLDHINWINMFNEWKVNLLDCFYIIILNNNLNLIKMDPATLLAQQFVNQYYATLMTNKAGLS